MTFRCFKLHGGVRLFLTGLIVASLTLSAANAVQPKRFVNNNEAEFAEGQTDQTVVTNLGDVKLTSDVATLAELPEEASVLFDAVRLEDGTLILAAGPSAELFALKPGGKPESILKLEDEQIFALTLHDGDVVAAISSDENSRIAVLRDNTLETLAEVADVRYIWQLKAAAGQDQSFVLAVGTPGRVLLVEAGDNPKEPTVTEWLKTAQDNVLCMVSHEDFLYAGTDKDGLVYRITLGDDAAGQEPYVVYDAAEPEIGAMVVTKDGTLYFGTADAEQARPGRMEQAVKEEEGRVVAAGQAQGEEGQPGEGEGGDGEAPGAPEIPGEAPKPQPMEAGGEMNEAVGPTQESNAEAADPFETESTVGNEGEQVQPDQEMSEPNPQVTSLQRDRLRDRIKAQLLDARESGQLQVGVGMQRGGNQGQGGPTGSQAKPMQQQQQKKKGNAIYRADTDGFVSEVFRESVMVLDLELTEDDRQLYVATGNEGQIYQVDLLDEETAVLTDADGKQITRLMPDGDQAVVALTSNPAMVLKLTNQQAASGTYTSTSFDAGQISLFGMIDIHVNLPEGTSLEMQTRSGNVADPDMAPWSAWTEAVTFKPGDEVSPLAPRSIKVTSPPARFLQYRLTLKGDGAASPIVDKVEMTYVMPNLRPVVSSIRAAYPDNKSNNQQADLPPPATVVNVEWKAEDTNGDRLIYNLAYQPAGTDKWLKLADDLQQNRYEWQTLRVPDGRYLLRLTASDRLDNPPSMTKTAVRQTDPVVVDNTAPTLKDLKKTVEDRTLTLTATAVDALLPIGGIGYILNDQESYEQVLPDDLIFDSTSEAFTVSIDDLSPGPHVMTLRVVDTRGNARYESILFIVE